MVVGVAGYYGFRNAGDEAILGPSPGSSRPAATRWWPSPATPKGPARTTASGPTTA